MESTQIGSWSKCVSTGVSPMPSAVALAKPHASGRCISGQRQARVVPCARPLHYRATTWYEAGRSRVMALDEGWGSRLNIPGKNLWCHWLDHTDFDHVCDDTDYTREVDGVYG